MQTDILDLRIAANYYVLDGDAVAAMVLDEIAHKLEQGKTWKDLLDDTEVKP